MYPDAKSEQLNLGIEGLITLENKEIFFVTYIEPNASENNVFL